MSVMAGMDFFTVEVLTWHGLATYYVLFLIELETGEFRWPDSPGIRRKSGCSRWLAM
jgi:hypothetical protein